MLRFVFAVLVAGACLCALGGRLDRADAHAAPVELGLPRAAPAAEQPLPVVDTARDRAAGLAAVDRRHRAAVH